MNVFWRVVVGQIGTGCGLWATSWTTLIYLIIKAKVLKLINSEFQNEPHKLINGLHDTDQTLFEVSPSIC